MQTPQRNPPKLLSRRLAVSLCSVLVVGLCVWGSAFFWSPLPRGAYPVVSTAQWAGRNPRYPQYAPFRWMPNGDLAHLEMSANGLLQVCYQKMHASGPVGGMRRGPEIPLGRLASTFAPSPDEKWVAYLQLANTGQYRTALVSADGKTPPTAPPIGEYFSGWLPDSRSFLCITTMAPLVLKVYHLDSSPTETIPPALQVDMPTPLSTLPRGPDFLIGGRFYQPLRTGGLAMNYPTMTMRSFQGSQPSVVQRTWQASVPLDMEFGYATVSPDNQRLLWLTAIVKPSLFTQWLTRLFPARMKVSPARSSYYLSDLHGQNMHRILDDRRGRTYSLAWTPDSKHLSFVYNEQLYLIPVD